MHVVSDSNEYSLVYNYVDVLVLVPTVLIVVACKVKHGIDSSYKPNVQLLSFMES